VAKTSFPLLLVVLVSALAGAQALAPVPGGSGPDLKTAYGGGALTCTQPHIVVVPRPILERVKLKARLADLPRASLDGDAQGIVDITGEKEIKKLANRLRRDKQVFSRAFSFSTAVTAVKGSG
jgi:hypothetical protein